MKKSGLAFRAIADPVRRALLDALLEGERNVTTLAAPFKISQPAVSQHLRVLRNAGLVRERRAGRERWYRVDLEALLPLAQWTQRYQSAWDERLDRLARRLRRRA